MRGGAGGVAYCFNYKGEWMLVGIVGMIDRGAWRECSSRVALTEASDHKGNAEP